MKRKKATPKNKVRKISKLEKSYANKIAYINKNIKQLKNEMKQFVKV